MFDLGLTVPLMRDRFRQVASMCAISLEIIAKMRDIRRVIYDKELIYGNAMNSFGRIDLSGSNNDLKSTRIPNLADSGHQI